MVPQNRPSPQRSRPPVRLPSSPPAALPSLPPLPSLEHLRKQAKHLLAAAQSGDAEALARLRRWFPGQPAPFKLTHAQLAVAREHGATSWAQLRRGALEALVERLAVRHWTEWRAAAAARAALHQAGEEGLLAVLEGLSHPQPRVRRGAVDFLNYHADDRSPPKLAELVQHDPVPYVRWSALRALQRQGGTIGAPTSTSDLTPVLARAAQDDPSPRVRWRALGSLSTPDLARVAREDPSPRVRLRALGVLGGRAGSALAEETLEGALQDAHTAVRHAAHQALRRLSPEYRQRAARRAREANRASAATAANRVHEAQAAHEATAATAASADPAGAGATDTGGAGQAQER